MATRARWETIAKVARDYLEQGLRPVLVSSALVGVTDLLSLALQRAPREEPFEAILAEIDARHEALAAEMGLKADAIVGEERALLGRLLAGAALLGESSARVRAAALACGELMASRLGHAFLAAQGFSSAWCDARELLEATGDGAASPERHYLWASCSCTRDAATRARLEELRAEVVVTQGFIARDADGDTVTLGRGGSDTSAACLAGRLGAERLDIWTDVPGMFTADPRQVPSARLLYQLDYDEAQELASTGARVLHPGSIAPVRAAGLALHLRWTEHPAERGTRVTAAQRVGEVELKAVNARTGVTLISVNSAGMWQRAGFLEDVFAAFARHGLSVDLVATSEAEITATLDPWDSAEQAEAVCRVVDELARLGHVRRLDDCAIISLVGRNIRAMLHRLAPALAVFEDHAVHLVSQAASDLNLSFVVDGAEAPRLVRELHAAVFASRLPDAVLGPTWQELSTGQGRVPVARAAPWWERRREELLHAAQRASPLYVYDAATVRASAGRLRDIGAVSRLFYAVKANWHPGVLAVLYDAGFGFECVSPGELAHVRGLFPGLARHRLLFTPNFASRQDYAVGLELAGHVTVDNLHPLEHWPELFAGREILLRVDPGRGLGHHRHVRTAGREAKFGIAPEQLAHAAQLAREAGACVVGLHAHVGSGVFEADTWAETAAHLAEAARLFPEVRALNVGGGLGVAERPGQTPLDLEALAAGLAQARAAWPKMELWLEPGRYLVAEAGVLLARVTQVKQKGEVTYVGIDAGMNSLLRPALYGAWHPIVNLTRLEKPAVMDAHVVGPICESGDVLGHRRRLPESREGDVFLIATTGAYGRAMASNYNLRPPAAELLLP